MRRRVGCLLLDSITLVFLFTLGGTSRLAEWKEGRSGGEAVSISARLQSLPGSGQTGRWSAVSTQFASTSSFASRVFLEARSALLASYNSAKETRPTPHFVRVLRSMRALLAFFLFGLL